MGINGEKYAIDRVIRQEGVLNRFENITFGRRMSYKD
jgi:hypothetical protein